MPYWLCIQTSYNLSVASPNAGYPQVIYDTGTPAYTRVLGPFTYEDDAKAANIVPYNTLTSPNGPNTTRGWYAVCPYNRDDTTPTSVYRDLPPNRMQYSAAYGPYDTQALADARALTFLCDKAFVPAQDICDPAPKTTATINLECSLVCSSLQWPQAGGTIQVAFYKDVCGQDAPLPSTCMASLIQVPLGCPPTLEPTVTTCWNGNTGAFQVQLINDPPRGYTVRLSGTMCVDADPNFVNVSVNLERLVNPIDIDPVHPPALPAWSSCGSFGGRIPITAPEPDKSKNRIYVSDLQAFSPSCAGLDSCIGYVQYSVFLIPQKFGCDGTAAGGAEVVDRCNLATNDHAYSCVSALVEPITTSPAPAFRPQYAQIGYSAVGTMEEHGCYFIKHPSAGTWTSDAIPKFFSISELANAGCPNETTVGNTQQVQFGMVAGFQVFIKRVAKGGFCMGMRVSNGDPWVVRYGTGITHVQNSIPYVDYAEFSTFNARMTIYVLEFPSPEVAGCYSGADLPPVTGPWPPITGDALVYDAADSEYLVYGESGSSLKPYDIIVWDHPTPYLGIDPSLADSPDAQPGPLVESPLEDNPTLAMARAMNATRQRAPMQPGGWQERAKRLRLPCVSLGDPVEEVAKCGCAGLPMRECARFEVCRVAGIDWDTRPDAGRGRNIQTTDDLKIPLCVDCEHYQERKNG